MAEPTQASFSAPPPDGGARAPPPGHRRKGRVLLALAVGFAAGSASTAALGLYAARALYASGPLAQARTLVVPKSGLQSLGSFLAEQGVVADSNRFLLAAMATRWEGPVHAAELAFPAGASLRDVLRVLRFSRPVQHLVSIPEGLTAKQIAAVLARNDALSGPAVKPAEGRMLPESYGFELGTTRDAIVERAYAAMDAALAKAWADRLPDLPLATAEEALILASIVERETGRPEERPRVAAVYLNRLRLGMKLQADPTVVYAVSGGAGTLDRPLTRADLDSDNPYNTYKVRGLPPGPIASPGIASMRAVTQPAASADLYFVADGTGRHLFSRTLDEHQRNVARLRALAPGSAVTAPQSPG